MMLPKSLQFLPVANEEGSDEAQRVDGNSLEEFPASRHEQHPIPGGQKIVSAALAAVRAAFQPAVGQQIKVTLVRRPALLQR